MISKIITSVLVILPEMDEVHPRLTSYSEYLDTDKTSLVPQSSQKCRLRDILSAKNGTNCNFYDKYESFLRCFNYFKPANFFQSVTKFVMNDKTAKNWHKMMIRKSNETMNIAEKNYFHFEILAAPLISWVWFFNVFKFKWSTFRNDNMEM